MPGIKEIKNRIGGVQDTRKITNAMYMIASTKLQKARRMMEDTKPFFDALRGEIQRILRVSESVRSMFFDPYDRDDEVICENKLGILVITADKGLAGAYNHNVIDEAMKYIDSGREFELYVVGEYGRHYFNQHKIPMEESFLYTAQNPTVRRAMQISWEILERYRCGALSELVIVYTEMKNGMESQVMSDRLLPLSREGILQDGINDEPLADEEYEFLPTPKDALEAIVPGYMSGYIYSALVDSFCSEQNARMTAMDSANRNAQEILDELYIEYNRVRQAAITQEITEVSAGARAQKKKKEKKRLRQQMLTEV